MTLDGTFASVIALGQQPDAYTTGTSNNVALIAAVNSLATTLASANADAEAWLPLPASFGPLDVNLTVLAAGILAGNTAALGFVQRVQTILGRP